MILKTLQLSDGASVRVIAAGDGAARPVLLLHGVGMRAEAWGPQMASLAQDHRVMAVDMPGHGESDPLAGKPGLPDYVAWAARVIAALGMGPVAVIGHSMGALIAAGLAVDHPTLVCRAALLNSVYRRTPEARAAVLARAREIAKGKGGIDAPLARWFTTEQAAIRDLVAGWLRDVPQQGYAAAYQAFAEGDATYADRLCDIVCPLLVLTGDGDPNATPQMTTAMAAMAPQGRAVVVAGHRHMVNLTAPDIVSAELGSWLAEKEYAA